MVNQIKSGNISSKSINERQLSEKLNYSSRNNAFEQILRQQLGEVDKGSKISELKFSKHAEQRVNQRGIQVTENLMDDLNTAVEKARQKGVKDLAVIGKNGAFIINVTNNIVVTTISEQEMKNNIFTNIDSAVII